MVVVGSTSVPIGGSYPAAVIVLDNFIITQVTRNIERVFLVKGIRVPLKFGNFS